MYYINPHIENLYRVKFHENREDALRLDMNENPIGLPAEFVEEVKKKITSDLLATYPQKGNLTRLLAEQNSIAPENISVTCGSDEALRLIFQCFGECGRELVTVTPTFEMYGVYSNMFGMKHIPVQYHSDFTISSNAILNAIGENTGIVILLNPNSPIGTIFEENEVSAIISKARENNAIVVIDEAYHYYYEKTFLALLEEFDNLLVLRTFSKLCSIAGLRLGYVSGCRELIHYIENAESTFNVSNIALLFAEEILKRPDVMEKMRAQEREGHEWLAEELRQAGYSFYTGEGNYLLFKPKYIPSEEIVRQLKKRGIWIRDYAGGILSGWVRVTTGDIGCMRQFWKAFLDIDGIN